MRSVMSIVWAVCLLSALNSPILAQEAKPVPEAEVYESQEGWSVTYNPELIQAEEGKDEAVFLYQGEAAGECKVSIGFIEGKQPEQALYDLTEDWGDQEDIQRFEGFFPGTDDKWGYWRMMSPLGAGHSRMLIAGEYGEGVLVIHVEAEMSGDDAIDIPMNDSLSGVIDSLTYEAFGPQEMYSYIPGTYTYTDEEGDMYEVVLNEDHTGVISIEDPLDILWGSRELIGQDGSFRYGYSMEGEMLILEYEGTVLTLNKVSD